MQMNYMEWKNCANELRGVKELCKWITWSERTMQMNYVEWKNYANEVLENIEESPMFTGI